MHRAHTLLAGASLCLGALLVLQLQAEEPQKKNPVAREATPGIRLICDVSGSLEAWGSDEYGYPYGNRTIALSPDGRWLAFPFVETVNVVKTPAEEAGENTGDWWVNLCDLTAAPGSECPRWRQGYLSMHSPVVAGPHNAVAFLSDDPLQKFMHEQLDRLWALEDTKGEGENEARVPSGVVIGGSETDKLPTEYIRVCWCGTGKSAYYRIPQGSIDEPRPRSRSRLIDLWFAENQDTKKPSLLALLFNGTLCLWTLENNGLPPAANVLMVEDEPRTLNFYNLMADATKTGRARQDDEFVYGLFAVAHRSNRIALCNPAQPPVRVISLASGKVRTLDVPKDLRDAPYQDLLLSENGRYCVAFRPAKRAGNLETATSSMPYPNVLETWNTETGKLLWQHILPDRFFVSRAAFSPDSSQLVTWSCISHDPEKDLHQLAGDVSDEEQQRQQEALYQTGLLQMRDAATGKSLGTFPFPAKSWIQALAFTPNGKQVVVLEHGGACQMIETTAFKSPK